MTKGIFRLGLISFLWILASCNQPENRTPEDAILEAISEPKVNLAEATYAQIAEYVYECRGTKLCVEVCHLPPGNPANSKTMELPLAATAAHLSHGGNHQDKDYLGPCDADESSGGDDGSGDDGSDDGSNDEIPNWCVPFYDYDQDCDGYYDDSVESYL